MSNTETMELFEQLQAEVKQLRQTLNGVNSGLDNLSELCKPTKDSTVKTDPHAPHENCHGCSGVGTEHCPDVCDQNWIFNQGSPLPNRGGIIAVHDGTWTLPCLFRDYQTATRFHQLVNRCCQTNTGVQPVPLDCLTLDQIPTSGDLYWVTRKVPIDKTIAPYWGVEQHAVIDTRIRLSLLIRVLQCDGILHKGSNAYVVWATSHKEAVGRVIRYLERQQAKNAD